MSDKRQFMASCEDVGDLKKGSNTRIYFIFAQTAKICTTKSFWKNFKRKVHYHLTNFAILSTKKRARTSQLAKSLS